MKSLENILLNKEIPESKKSGPYDFFLHCQFLAVKKAIFDMNTFEIYT